MKRLGGYKVGGDILQAGGWWRNIIQNPTCSDFYVGATKTEGCDHIILLSFH